MKNPFRAAGVAMLFLTASAAADTFTKEDLARWAAEQETVVAKGRAHFTDAKLGSNGVVCAQCHPNAANTHPETYPKFQKQLGKVAQFWEIVNWCIRNPLEGEDLAPDDPRMTALIAYMMHERRGVALEAGKH